MLDAPGGSADDDDPKQAPKRNCKHSATATRSIGLQVNCRIFQVDQVSVPKMINNGGMEDEVMVIRDRHESHKSKGLNYTPTRCCGERRAQGEEGPDHHR